jgi:hypothetical protein
MARITPHLSNDYGFSNLIIWESKKEYNLQNLKLYIPNFGGCTL